MIGAIGGAGGVIGGVGNIGAMGGITSAATVNVAVGAVSAAPPDGTPTIPPPPGISVNISAAAKAALTADIQQAAVAGPSNTAAVQSTSAVNGASSDTTVNLGLLNFDLNAWKPGVSGSDDLDKLITALLLALLMRQQSNG
jgi:hypothetical protein